MMELNARAGAAILLLLGMTSFTTLSIAEELDSEPEDAVELSIPKGLLSPPENAAQLRAMQIRRIEIPSERQAFEACITALQDLGFSLTLHDQSLGLVRGVKDRPAEAPEQVLAINVLNLLAILGGSQPASYEEDQTINVMVVLSPVPQSEPRAYDLRVTFHRFLRQPFRIRAEVLDSPELYQSFYALFNKVLFLQEESR